MMTEHNLSKTASHRRREARHVAPINIRDWKILLIDDQRDNLTVAETALRFHGAEVRTAPNGLEGLRELEQFAATVILLDLSMPEMNGWEMFEQLRQNPATAQIPVIALTAHAMASDKTRVMEAGFNGYIPKPFSIATLVSDILAILQTIPQGESNNK